MDHQKVRYQKRKYSVWEILSFALLALGIVVVFVCQRCELQDMECS